MKCIPTRIAGVELVRCSADRPQNAKQPALPRVPRRIDFPVEDIAQGKRGFTAQLCFSRTRALERSFHCDRGEVFLVVADLRLGSPTFGHWQGFYLRGDDDRTIHIPAGVASGWQVTSRAARVVYRNSCEIQPDDWRWLPWHDLTLAIAWPNVPEKLAAHSRRIRSLATLPSHRLPTLAREARRASRTGPTETEPNISRIVKAAQGQRVRPSPLPLTRQPDNQRPQLILVVGSSGQLGRDLCRHLRCLGTVVGACRQPDRTSLLPVPLQVDVSRPASIRQAIRRVKPTLIVNACGLTDLVKAEVEPRLAQAVNATASAILADEAKQVGAALVHFCSDMVFDGSGDRPWRESDTPHPISQYGRTKLLGTTAISQSGVPHLIIRAGWLYSNAGDNFLTKLVDLLTYRNSIHLASDHFGTPTSTDWLAKMTAEILSTSKGQLQEWLEQNGGLYHLAPLGYASRLEVGDQIVATCRAHALPIVSNKLQGQPLASFSSLVPHPLNCRLDCSKMAMRFGISLPRWQEELASHVSELLGSKQQYSSHIA